MNVTGSPVFISHASRNFSIADDIRRRLEDIGICCWIAPRDIPPGSSYGEQITDSIRAASALVLVLTDEANSSRAVANELEMAFRFQRVIIPIRLKPVEPSSSLAFFLNNTQWVDAFHTPLKVRVHEIARIVRALTAGTQPHPPEPEQKTIPGELEMRIEGLIRHKLLAMTVVLFMIACAAGVGAVMSSKTWSRMQVEQNLIDKDPTTFGLVNLSANPDPSNSSTDLQLEATVYLNLQDAISSGVTWKIYWSVPGESIQTLNSTPLASLRAAGVQRLPFSVPTQVTAVVFCMTAAHPRLAGRYTAKWRFTVDATNGQVMVNRSGAPQLMQTADQECAP